MYLKSNFDFICSYYLCTSKPLSLRKTGLTYGIIQGALKFSKMMNIFDRVNLYGKCTQAKDLNDIASLPK